MRNCTYVPSDFCCLAVRLLGYKGVEIGRHLDLGRTRARAAVRRGQDVVEGNPELPDIPGP